MSLDLTHLRDPEDWAARRVHKDKHRFAPWIAKFNRIVSKLDYPTSVGYRDQGEFTYLVGCPAFTLFKLTYKGFFIDRGFNTQEWRDCSDSPDGLDSLLKHNLHKWQHQPLTVCPLPEDFIFFPIQMMSGQLRLIVSVLQWAKKNKRHVVFKGHPYTDDDRPEQDIWDILERKGMLSEYTTLVTDVNADYLVEKCSALWSQHSGLGLIGVLKDKPVAYFLREEDYCYHPLATFCATPEDAEKATPADPVDIRRYFNWYYENVGIDLLRPDDDIEQQIRRRIEKHLC